MNYMDLDIKFLVASRCRALDIHLVLFNINRHLESGEKSAIRISYINAGLCGTQDLRKAALAMLGKN
jgi:hypothetical protein